MLWYIFELAGIVIFLYMLLPTILGRGLCLGARKRGPNQVPQVALTFDDGPDPLYTPQVLAILKKYDARATFFVVGEYAARHPELIRQILDQGHNLGTHGQSHRFAWLQSPGASIAELRRGRQTLEAITGAPTRFCRPSWGVFNLPTYLYLLVSRQQTVLWSLMSWDWQAGKKPSDIANQVQRKVRPGSVLLFHDRSTPPGAAVDGPANMLQALPVILENLSQRGLKPVTLEVLLQQKQPGLVKQGLRRVWRVWEYCFDRLAGLRPVGDQKNNLFRLAVRHYRGQVMQLPDGTCLTPGDQVGEIHFNNDLLQNLSSTARSLEGIGILLLRETRRSLPLLAKTLAQDPSYQGIKALIGITMIHRGTTQLGFSVYDLSPSLRPMVAWYQRWLLFLLHPGGFAHLRRQWHKLVPKKVVISRQELIKRYGLEGIGWSESGNTSPAKGSINAR